MGILHQKINVLTYYHLLTSSLLLVVLEEGLTCMSLVGCLSWLCVIAAHLSTLAQHSDLRFIWSFKIGPSIFRPMVLQRFLSLKMTARGKKAEAQVAAPTSPVRAMCGKSNLSCWHAPILRCLQPNVKGCLRSTLMRQAQA